MSQLLARSLGAFAAIAVLLASVGNYGVVAYGVHQRAALPIAAGLAIGFGGVLLSARLIARFLFQTAPLEPGTVAAAVVVLTSIALMACWIPARRAAQVDPLMALRDG